MYKSCNPALQDHVPAWQVLELLPAVSLLLDGITDAPDVLDEARVLGVIPQLFAQVADVHHDGVAYKIGCTVRCNRKGCTMPTAHEYLAPCIRQRKDGRLQAYSKYKDAQGEWKQKSCLIPQSITSKRSAKKYANEWWRELRASESEDSPTPTDSTAASPHQRITRYTVTEMIQFMLDDKLTSGVIERSTYSKEMTTLRRVERHPIGRWTSTA